MTLPPFVTLPCLSAQFSTSGGVFGVFRLSEEDADYLASGKQYLAPTTDEEVSTKLAGCWTDITKRAEEAAKEEERRSASAVVDGQSTLKRIRTDGERSSATGKARLSYFGRCAVVDGAGGSQEGGDDDDLVRQVVARDVLRYQGLYKFFCNPTRSSCEYCNIFQTLPGASMSFAEIPWSEYGYGVQHYRPYSSFCELCGTSVTLPEIL